MKDMISIIMPVRNGIPYLEECLNSIINQSYQNWELLVVNDHSTDDTQKTLERFSKKDTRIIPHINKGKGIIDALNTGYDHSSGAYVTRMDADDIMPDDKLETLRKLIYKETDISVATGHVKYISESGVKDGYKSYEQWLNQLCDTNSHYRFIYKECVIASPAWMMRKDHFESIGGFKSDTYPEDYDLCFRMYESNVEVLSTSKIVHLWRDHGNRTSRNDENYADNRFLDLKLEYFKKIDSPKHANIILLGAGKKGKTTAKYFIENNIQFTWVTNNTKKIGINIYGVILRDYEVMQLDQSNTAIIITIANKQEQQELKQRLSDVSTDQIYYFC